MQLEERTSGDVTVVTITGDITLNKGGDVLLKDKIQLIIDRNTPDIIA